MTKSQDLRYLQQVLKTGGMESFNRSFANTPFATKARWSSCASRFVFQSLVREYPVCYSAGSSIYFTSSLDLSIARSRIPRLLQCQTKLYEVIRRAFNRSFANTPFATIELAQRLDALLALSIARSRIPRLLLNTLEGRAQALDDFQSLVREYPVCYPASRKP